MAKSICLMSSPGGGNTSKYDQRSSEGWGTNALGLLRGPKIPTRLDSVFLFSSFFLFFSLYDVLPLRIASQSARWTVALIPKGTMPQDQLVDLYYM